MMEQNVRTRRPKTATAAYADTPNKNESLSQKVIRYTVQISILGLVSIIIFYGIRFIYMGFHRNAKDTEFQSFTSGDAEELGIFWTQPVITKDSIPSNIFTLSPSDECQLINQDWTLRQYTEQEALLYVQHELQLSEQTLSKLQFPLDLFKYVILDKYGGFYMDQNAECKDGIDDWFDYFIPTRHVHYNNYKLTTDMLNNEDLMNKYTHLDMIVAFESMMPYSFSNWAFFSKPNNPILQFAIHAYLDYLGAQSETPMDKAVSEHDKKANYVGPEIFTETLRGFVDTFTSDPHLALTFHKFEDGKGHIVTLYLDGDESRLQQNGDTMMEKGSNELNILVVPLPEMQRIVRRRKGIMRRTSMNNMKQANALNN